MIKGLIFFSYSRENTAFVNTLVEHMQKAGVNLWVDQSGIETGAKWDQKIEEAIKSSPKLLAVLSKASVSSENCLDEISLAIEHNKKVIPILIEPCEIPFRLKRIQYIDFTQNLDEAMDRLITDLELPAKVSRRLKLNKKTYKALDTELAKLNGRKVKSGGSGVKVFALLIVLGILAVSLWKGPEIVNTVSKMFLNEEQPPNQDSSSETVAPETSFSKIADPILRDTTGDSEPLPPEIINQGK